MVARSQPSATPGADDNANPFADSSDIFGAFAGSGAGAKPIDVEFRRIEAPCPEPPTVAKPVDKMSDDDLRDWYAAESYGLTVWGIDEYLRRRKYLCLPDAVARACGGAVLTFAALSDFPGSEVFPHVRTIAKRAGLVQTDELTGDVTDDGTRTVKRHIAKLAAAGAIEVRRPTKYAGNRYRVSKEIETTPCGKYPKGLSFTRRFLPAYCITLGVMFDQLHMCEQVESTGCGSMDGRNELSISDVCRRTRLSWNSAANAFRSIANDGWFDIRANPWDSRYAIVAGPRIIRQIYQWSDQDPRP